MNQKAISFLKKCNIPGALPQMYNLANKVANEPNVPQAKLTRILSADIVISANILKQINASTIKGQDFTANLAHSISKLGTKQVQLILKNMHVQAPFKEDINTCASIEEFWKHSLAVGTYSRIIDRTLGGNSDELYSAGLLHDFGRLLMFINTDDIDIVQLATNCQLEKELLYKHERKKLGFNHMELADALFSQWNMPATVRETAAFHHSPRLAIRCRYEAAVVHIADIICRAMELGTSGDNFVPILDTAIVRFLNFDNNMLDYICEETSHQLEERLKVYEL